MAKADDPLMLMRSFMKVLIRLYRYAVSPFLGDSCRFYPSCSHYAEEAVEQHGVIRGSWLTIKRLSRCHPLHEGGIDLVPPPPHNHKI